MNLQKMEHIVFLCCLLPQTQIKHFNTRGPEIRKDGIWRRLDTNTVPASSVQKLLMLKYHGLAVVSKQEGGFCKYCLSNGTEFGIKQCNVLNETELSQIESNVYDELHKVRTSHTRDHEPHKSRTKLFFGYRYSYGKGTTTLLYEDVDPIPTWIHALINTLRKKKICGDIDQVTINHYETTNASIGVHQDSIALFERPIYSLRLLSDSVLSFGCKGLGMKKTHEYVGIPLKRGIVTVMEGFAADIGYTRRKHIHYI